jgi:hypothetical protein
MGSYRNYNTIIGSVHEVFMHLSDRINETGKLYFNQYLKGHTLTLGTRRTRAAGPLPSFRCQITETGRQRGTT